MRKIPSSWGKNLLHLSLRALPEARLFTKLQFWYSQSGTAENGEGMPRGLVQSSQTKPSFPPHSFAYTGRSALFLCRFANKRGRLKWSKFSLRLDGIFWILRFLPRTLGDSIYISRLNAVLNISKNFPVVKYLSSCPRVKIMNQKNRPLSPPYHPLATCSAEFWLVTWQKLNG